MNGHLHLCGLSSEFSETSEKECVHYYGDGKCNHLSNYGSDCDDIEYVPISEMQSTLARVTAEKGYYQRATDFLDSLIAGFGGAIDDERLRWYKDNPLPPAISRIEEGK